MADRAKAAYRWWDNLATINAEDPFWLGALKIGFRALGGAWYWYFVNPNPT